jgi:hypothetical protein
MKVFALLLLASTSALAADSSRVAEMLREYDAQAERLAARFPTTPPDQDITWLRAKLANMAALDQLARAILAGPQLRELAADDRQILDHALTARLKEVDAMNRVTLSALVKTHGWFTIDRYGAQTDHDAWLIVQHADADPDFQRQMLTLLEPLAARGATDPKNFAYLFDRVAVSWNDSSQRKLQRFGTQGQCSGPGAWEPLPVEDPEHLEERRAQAGLEPMTTYKAYFRDVCVESTEDALRRAQEAARKASAGTPAQ